MNIKSYLSIGNLWICLLFCLNTNLSAQQERIQLKDAKNGLPIISAAFQYGDQSGLSNDQGWISFQFREQENMLLTHLSYGKWELSPVQIQAAIQSGFISRQEQILDLYPVTVIALHSEQEDLQNIKLNYQDKMAHDAGAILNQSPSISSIRKSANYGFDPVLRGFKYDQLNIVLDGGQSAVAACPNRMDPPSSQMAPNMLERVEILKGPHALRYGNGFGGTINFVSTASRFSEHSGIYGRLSGRYGTNGNLGRSEGLLGFSGRHYDLGLFGSLSRGDDYRDGSGNTVPADFLRGSFGSKLGLKLSDQQQLSLGATYNFARDADFAALAMDLRDDDTWLFNLNHRLEFGYGKLQSWNTALYGTFVDHLMDNRLKPLDPRMMNAETAARTRTYGGRTEGKWQFAKTQLYLGGDLKVEEAEGSRVRTFLMGPNNGKVLTDNAWQHGRISKISLFSEYRIIQDRMQWVLSGRLELNQAKVLDVDDAFASVYPTTTVEQINPSLSIGGVRTFSNAFSLGLWLGRAQRSGSLTERYINYFAVGQDPYEMLGNPQLNPEVNHQVDLNFSWKKERTNLQLDVFTAFLTNNISSVIDPDLNPVLPNSPGVRRFINIDRAFKAGFEIGWKQELFAGLQHQLSLAYTYGQDLEREEPLPEIAPLDFRYRLIGSYLKDRLRPEVSFRQVLGQERISTEFGESSTPSFTLLDASIAYQMNKRINFSLGGQNLFDVNYYEHLNRSVRGMAQRPIYAPGRNFFLAMNVSFM